MKYLIVINIFIGMFHDSLSIPSNWEHCARNMFPCVPICLPCEARCNRVSECADRSDEYECAPRLLCAEGHTAFGLNNGLSLILNNNRNHTINDGIISYIISGGEIENQIRCGALPTIENGQSHLVDYDSSVGATAGVICNDGYKSCKQQVKCHCSKVWETAECVPEKTSNIKCYSCDGKTENDDCNLKTETCPNNKQSCETSVEWKGDVCKISKGCKNPNSGNQNLGCKKYGSKTVCKYKCEGDLCNDALPISDCDTCGSHEEDTGACTRRNFPTYQDTPLPLKSSGCKKYCTCTYRADVNRYRWVKQRCPGRTLFDMGRKACFKKAKVMCLAPGEEACINQYGICSQSVNDISPKRVLSNTYCKKYCECKCDCELNTGKKNHLGIPIYSWRQKTCGYNKLFDKDKGRCKPSSRVSCSG